MTHSGDLNTMTAALIVTTGGRQTGKVLIEKDAFVIGRSRRCDLVLEDKNVSREHAVVVAQSGRYQIRDRGSRNSTLLNGVQLTAQAPLKEGDKIRIGPYELRFLESAGPSADGEQELSKTGFIPAGKPQQQNERTDLKNKAAHVGLVYKLTALSGPQKGNSWSNWSGDLTFGRAADNTVVLQEDVVSLVHATISRTDGHFCIDDPGSSNGTFVQGGRVRSARLQHNQQ
ncbi:MAG: FHA domain-containing protein, partial [bacterium]